MFISSRNYMIDFLFNIKSIQYSYQYDRIRSFITVRIHQIFRFTPTFFFAKILFVNKNAINIYCMRQCVVFIQCLCD